MIYPDLRSTLRTMKGGNKGEVEVIKGKAERINVLTKGEDYDEEGEINNIPWQFMDQMAEIGQRLNKTQPGMWSTLHL